MSVGRRQFLQGLGALGVTLGFGKRVVSREADRLSDAVIQEGVDLGMYGQEIADEFIGFDKHVADVGEIDVTISGDVDPHALQEVTRAIAREVERERTNPLLSLVDHDWSRELGYVLEKDFDVHVFTHGGSHFQMPEAITPVLQCLSEGESINLSEPALIHKTYEFEHMYCSFIIGDAEVYELDARNLRMLFFQPALMSFKAFIEEQGMGKRLAGRSLEMPHPFTGLRGRVSYGGPIPIRTTVAYDMALCGYRVNMDFMAKVF